MPCIRLAGLTTASALRSRPGPSPGLALVPGFPVPTARPPPVPRPGSGPAPPIAGPGAGPAAPTPTEPATRTLPDGSACVNADPEVPAVVGAAVEGLQRLLRVPLVVVPDKGKASAAAAAALEREEDVSDVPELLKQRRHVLRSSTEGKVSHSK